MFIIALCISISILCFFTLRNWAKLDSISRHYHKQTLLEVALLALVPVHPHDGTVIILQALLILDVLLNVGPKKTLHSDLWRLAECGPHCAALGYWWWSSLASLMST